MLTISACLLPEMHAREALLSVHDPGMQLQPRTTPTILLMTQGGCALARLIPTLKPSPPGQIPLTWTRTRRRCCLRPELAWQTPGTGPCQLLFLHLAMQATGTCIKLCKFQRAACLPCHMTAAGTAGIQLAMDPEHEGQSQLQRPSGHTSSLGGRQCSGDECWDHAKP